MAIFNFSMSARITHCWKRQTDKKLVMKYCHPTQNNDHSLSIIIWRGSYKQVFVCVLFGIISGSLSHTPNKKKIYIILNDRKWASIKLFTHQKYASFTDIFHIPQTHLSLPPLSTFLVASIFQRTLTSKKLKFTVDKKMAKKESKCKENQNAIV